MRGLDELPYLDLERTRYLTHPVQSMQEVAAVSPVARTSHGFYVVDGRLIEQLARDRRLEDGHAGELPALVGLREDGPAFRFRTQMMLSQQGRPHARLRSTVSAFFSPNGVQKLRGDIAAIIDDLLQACPSQEPVQFFAEVCAHVPARLFCRMVDIPKSEAPFVSRISDAVLQIFARDPRLAPGIEDGYDELFHYVSDLMAEREKSLGDDLLSQLIRSRDAGKLNDQEVYDMVVMLLEASTDNTSNQMAMAVSDLLGHPDQFALLRGRPELAANAAMECVRIRPRVLLLRRTTREEYLLEDVLVPAGTELVLPVLAAQFSEDRFPRADVFDVSREHKTQMPTFGGGAHACLGSVLAMLEIEEMLAALTRKYPDAAIAGDVEINNNREVQFVTSLPVVIGRPAMAKATG